MIATVVIFSHDMSMVCLSMIHSENRYHIPCTNVPANRDPMLTIDYLADQAFGLDKVGQRWFLKHENNEYNTILDMDSHRYVATCVADEDARPRAGYGWVNVASNEIHEILMGLDNPSDYSYIMDSLILHNAVNNMKGDK